MQKVSHTARSTFQDTDITEEHPSMKTEGSSPLLARGVCAHVSVSIRRLVLNGECEASY